MRRFAFALLTLGTTISSTAAAQRSLGSLQWFVGCWEATRGTTRTIERWRAPAQNEMAGDSRTIANGADRQSEKLRLFARGDTIVYEATPSGQLRTEFRTTTVGPEEVVFSNPAHDFPQRIVYRKVGNDSLVARIEGDRDNRRRPVSYPYRKIDCSTIVDSPTSQARTAHSLRQSSGSLFVWRRNR